MREQPPGRSGMITTKVRIRVLAAAIACAAAPALASDDRPSAADATLFDRLDTDHDGQVTGREVPAEHKRLFARLVRRADSDGNQSLSRNEFVGGLVPTRPEKPIEEKQSSAPQADAVRWLLLSMDTSGNSSIEVDEVPERLLRVFDAMVERMDGNKNGVIDRREMYQGARPLAQIAGRYVQSRGIDTAAELKKLDQKLGPAARRFDQSPPRLDNLGDPQQTQQLFRQLDANGDGRIETTEVEGPLERAFERLTRMADRDNDGQLTEREFLAGARQIARRQARQAARQMRSESMPAEKAMLPNDEAMPAD